MAGIPSSSPGRVNNTTPNVSTATVKTVQSSTPVSDITKREVLSSGQSNVLNGYRSSTYKWTLAALKKGYDKNPELYRSSSLELVILESGGKGTRGIVSPDDLSSKIAEANKKYQRVATDQAATVDSVKAAEREKSSTIERLNSTDGLVASFNAESPGRFDMFIDRVEIYSLFGFGESGQTVTQPNSFKFEVIEPYSVNGFMEALQVAGVAAGNASYLQSNYVLKLEFLGYPDNDLSELRSAEVIPNSTRYFPFRFLNVEMEITESGAKYRCSGGPISEKAFGNPDVLKKPISASGNKVGEVLRDLMNNLNSQVKANSQNSKTPATLNSNQDEYEIKFPAWDSKNGWDFEGENNIAKADITKILKDPAIYKFPDPAKEENKGKNNYNPRRSNSPKANSSAGGGRGSGVDPRRTDAPDPNSVMLHPGAGGSKPQIQFAEKARLSHIIAAVIRDSEYLKNILKDIDQNVDQFGYIDYFLIRTETVQKEDYDPVAKRNYEKYTFVVSPYKIHFTKIPGYQSHKVPESKMKVLSLREYNYLYTGKNLDVLGFKLNFNNLFFEANPVNNGNTDQPNSKQGIAREGSSVVRNTGAGGSKEEISTRGVPTPQSATSPDSLNVVADGVTGNQRQDDPYSILAKNMHNAITNSKASMLSGDLEILGDPFFLVTGGIGNYNPKPSLSGPQSTLDGEANQIYGDVLVTINFRNPVDINSLDKGGLHFFDKKRVPFSGVYSVQNVTSTFQDGLFKQKLNVLRAPGQVLDEFTNPTNKTETLGSQFKLVPKAIDSPMTPTTVGIPAGERPDTLNLLSQQQRGLPSPGLPGMLSNFTAAVGGLGGNASSLLSQVSGAVTNGIGKLTAAASVFGGSIPGGADQLASGIRLNAAGVTNLAQSVLGSAALVSQVSNSLQNSFPVTNVAVNLASNIVSKANSVINSVSAPGSGIGVGASVFIEKSAVSAATALAGASTLSVPDSASLQLAGTTSLPTDIRSISGIGSSLSGDALARVAALGSSSKDIVNGIGDKIKSLSNGVSTDPTAIAGKFGINAQQLSGLSGNLQSKILSQVADISKSIPADTDLSKAMSQGLVVDFIPATKFGNIPASMPYSVASAAEVNQADLQSIAAKGGPAALARAFGVSDITKISSDLLPADLKTNILSSVNTNLNNPLASLKTQFSSVDSKSLGDKLLSAKSQLSTIAGTVGQSVESKLSSVNSIVGSTVNSGGKLALSVTSQFGSIASSNSPLEKLINNNIGGA
jgi:hypothetical protein